MAFWNKIFQRGRSMADPIPTGRKSATGINSHGILSPYRSRIADILGELRRIPDEANAIDFLGKKVPDVSMALWNFLRLANQGHEMKFYDYRDKEKRLPDVEARWREFAARINEISNAGMDGLIDILHQLAFIRGAQALEVEVSKDRTEIVDVHPIIPQTIYWELEERNGRKVFIPYQQQFMGKVSLEKGKANFFWVPTDPDPGDPRGNLILSPVLQAVDFQIQTLLDLQAVLHHQGWPRNDIKIILERVMNAMPQEVKASAKAQKEWLRQKWEEIVNTMNNLEPDDDYIHWDDIEINMNQGGNVGRGLDVRAVAELVDVQTISGTKQMGVFMNRTGAGVTETFSTVQFRIFTSGLKSVQRGSKRIIEEVARLWLRVSGVQAIPHFEHNAIDWRSELDVIKVKLMQEEFWAIAQLMGWVDEDKAAQEVTGVEKAAGKPIEDRVRVTFSAGGVAGSAKDDSKGGVRKREDLSDLRGIYGGSHQRKIDMWSVR